MKQLLISLTVGLLSCGTALAQADLEPSVHIHATRGETSLEAHVFATPDADRPRPAVIVFHGGGWTMGDPSWAHGPARHFAGLGLVAVAAQYRLSGEKHPGVTPIEAMADARSAIRWARENAEELGIDPRRIAAYGWSAGAHLIACAAILADADGEGETVSCVPDIMMLSSPALSLHEDSWLKKILGDRAEPADISPDVLVRKGLPPTLLLQGRTDTVTRLAGTQRFHDAMIAAGNESALIVYDGVGHLFTPSTESDRGWPNPDPTVLKSAYDAMDRFLESHGYTGRVATGTGTGN